eukprot:gene34934-45214_t
MAALKAAITPATRMLIVNSPNNPTGWTLSRAEQIEILAHCRQTGTWILADEVYERLYYEGDTANGCAPSFLDVAEADDRLVVVHSFSKSFLMTGWRLGWLVMPPAMTHHMGKLIEFNTSCASVFTQRAGIVALQNTADITPRVVAHLKDCRNTLVPLLQAVPGVQLAPAKGGMYAFFKLEGHPDSVQTAKRLVAEAGLGLAPGEAFAPEAAGWLRWCFASKDLSRLEQGVQRLRDWLECAMSTASEKQHFQSTGLYDPANEHDACGVGFVAHIKGHKTHAIVTQALKILENLDHRGAVGADALMGDGAGILIQLPDALYRDEMAKQGIALPPFGEYGVGMVFLPKEHASRM